MKNQRWPCFPKDEINAVVQVLRSGKINYWTGEECKKFEREFADLVGMPYAVSLANGTLALELALHALDIGAGDDVVVPCRSFIASASCVVARGARPIMADIDPVSQNISVETIRQALTPKTKAVIVVHLAGWPCEMDAIMKFARQHHLKVIEDCAQAHGAKYKDHYVGSFGDAATFSFCQDKIITTGGEGGMLLLKSKKHWQKAWAYKDHGKNSAIAMLPASSFGFRWTHDSFGSNWRMTEMQAAIGRAQLKKLTAWVSLRRRNADILTKFFGGLSLLRLTIPNSSCFHAYYRYSVFLRSENLGPSWTRAKIIEAMKGVGVPCFSGSCPELYLEKAFQNSDLPLPKRFQVAKELGETSLVFLVHPTLTEKAMHSMCHSAVKIFQQATKK